MSSISDGEIPPRAVEWIYAVLHEENNPEPTFHLGRLLRTCNGNDNVCILFERLTGGLNAHTC